MHSLLIRTRALALALVFVSLVRFSLVQTTQTNDQLQGNILDTIHGWFFGSSSSSSSSIAPAKPVVKSVPKKASSSSAVSVSSTPIVLNPYTIPVPSWIGDPVHTAAPIQKSSSSTKQASSSISRLVSRAELLRLRNERLARQLEEQANQQAKTPRSSTAYSAISYSSQQIHNAAPQSSAQTISSAASTISSTVTSIASSTASIFIPSTVAGKIFYIDPARGSKTGDGSAAKPWKSFQEVVAAKLISGDDATKGIVHGGDAIYLMTGEYGLVRPPATNNTDYITIQAAPGQTPVFTNLAMAAGGKWAFKGITFRNNPGGPAGQLIRVTLNDFIFTDNTVYSEADVSSWSPDYWVAHASIALTFTGNNAIISHNTFKNVRRGVTLVGDHIEFTYNTIDVHANDALDFTVSNTLIGHNSITNHYGKIDDGLHNDAMQGWTLNGDIASNVTIDSNTIIESTGAYPWIPLVPSGINPEYMQGISIFDGKWKNVTVTNNLIVVSAGHAISLYGVQGGLIANNTVIRKTADTVWDTFIALMPLTVDGTEPANIIVRNNLAPSFRMPEKGSNIFDHNIAYLKQWQPWQKSIPVIPMEQIFVQPDPARGPLDYHLKNGSPAIGAGLSDGVPLIDLEGKARNAGSIDIGAYAK